MDPKGNTTSTSSTYQHSVGLHVFTVERCDDGSTNDPSISGDDNSNSTSSDEESNQEISMNTTTIENRYFTVPNSTLFSVDIMITKLK